MTDDKITARIHVPDEIFYEFAGPTQVNLKKLRRSFAAKRDSTQIALRFLMDLQRERERFRACIDPMRGRLLRKLSVLERRVSRVMNEQRE